MLHPIRLAKRLIILAVVAAIILPAIGPSLSL